MGPVLIPAILSHAKPVCRNQQADMMLIAKSDPIDSGKGCAHTRTHMSLTIVNNKQLHRAHTYKHTYHNGGTGIERERKKGSLAKPNFGFDDPASR